MCKNITVSFIFTIITLIIINIILVDYDIKLKYQIGLFISIFILFLFSNNFYEYSLNTRSITEKENVVIEVFKELDDNKDNVNNMSEKVKPTLLGGTYELNIEPIPPILTTR